MPRARLTSPAAPASEHQEQTALIRLVDLYAQRYPALLNLFSVPNAGKRTAAVATWMVEEGLRSGVPDIFLAWPRKNRHGYCDCGLFIELKRDGGRLGPLQAEWHTRLRAAGYRVEVAYGCLEAWACICDYLAIPNELEDAP